MKIILIVTLWFNGGGRKEYKYEMPDWGACIQAVSTAVVKVSHGNESEAMAVAFCAYDKQ